MKNKLFFILLTLLITGCAGKAFVDARREAGTITIIGESTTDMVAICYHPSKATKKQIYSLANKECSKTNKKAQFSHKSNFTCRLTIPNHVYFKCIDAY